MARTNNETDAVIIAGKGADAYQIVMVNAQLMLVI